MDVDEQAGLDSLKKKYTIDSIIKPTLVRELG